MLFALSTRLGSQAGPVDDQRNEVLCGRFHRWPRCTSAACWLNCETVQNDSCVILVLKNGSPILEVGVGMTWHIRQFYSVLDTCTWWNMREHEGTCRSGGHMQHFQTAFPHRRSSLCHPGPTPPGSWRRSGSMGQCPMFLTGRCSMNPSLEMNRSRNPKNPEFIYIRHFMIWKVNQLIVNIVDICWYSCVSFEEAGFLPFQLIKLHDFDSLRSSWSSSWRTGTYPRPGPWVKRDRLMNVAAMFNQLLLPSPNSGDSFFNMLNGEMIHAYSCQEVVQGIQD